MQRICSNPKWGFLCSFPLAFHLNETFRAGNCANIFLLCLVLFKILYGADRNMSPLYLHSTFLWLSPDSCSGSNLEMWLHFKWFKLPRSLLVTQMLLGSLWDLPFLALTLFQWPKCIRIYKKMSILQAEFCQWRISCLLVKCHPTPGLFLESQSCCFQIVEPKHSVQPKQWRTGLICLCMRLCNCVHWHLRHVAEGKLRHLAGQVSRSESKQFLSKNSKTQNHSSEIGREPAYGLKNC